MRVDRAPHDDTWWPETGTTGVEKVYVTLEPSGTPTGWRIVSFTVGAGQA